MTDRPILFSAPMIRALLDGCKTQTRRVFRFPKKTHSGGPIYERPDMGGWEPTTHGGSGTFYFVRGQKVPAPETVGMWHKTTGVGISAEYQHGDRLWVRERVYADRMVNIITGERSTNAIVAYYHADEAEVCDHLGFNLAWQWKRLSMPAIHMPRFFSRLTLIVEKVRVERLQDITEADALAEGVAINSGYPGSARDAFEALWADINGPTAWAENPWVAAISFRVVRANIDALTDDGRPLDGANA